MEIEDCMDASLLRLMQKKVAVSAIPPSAMRRQGLAGLLVRMRTNCLDLDLGALADSTQVEFSSFLDRATVQLCAGVADLRCEWGAARKALNLFLRDATYNHYLREQHRLSTIEDFLELPLDRQVADRLVAEKGRDSLPLWPGVHHLQPHESQEYQHFAARVADKHGCSRVHLDLYYWPAVTRAAV
jgi:hypothetical protein